jgi:non-ribosomal peptide synthetase component F
MTIRQTTLAAAFALAAIGPAHAEGLKPLQGQVIGLGERDGFRVVATLAKKHEDAVPVRVVAVLAPGQTLTLSTPREWGTPAEAVDFVRRADTVLVHEAPATRADTVLAHKAAAAVTN